jgi:hypothetical protein
MTDQTTRRCRECGRTNELCESTIRDGKIVHLCLTCAQSRWRAFNPQPQVQPAPTSDTQPDPEESRGMTNDQYRAERLANGLIRVRDYQSGLTRCFRPHLTNEGVLSVKHAHGDLLTAAAYRCAYAYVRTARITL